MSAATEEIVRRAYAAFRQDLDRAPTISLRGGEALDRYAEPPPYDPYLDAPTDDYLRDWAWHGLAFVDAASWRHYLPRLMDYTLRHLDDRGTMAPEALLQALRPPDRDPPRLASLTAGQERVIVDFLEALMVSPAARCVRLDELAMQVLEEWWIPGALYRDRPLPGAGEG